MIGCLDIGAAMIHQAAERHKRLVLDSRVGILDPLGVHLHYACQICSKGFLASLSDHTEAHECSMASLPLRLLAHLSDQSSRALNGHCLSDLAYETLQRLSTV